MILRKTSIIIFIGFILLTISCSIPGKYYIRNLTDENAIVTLNLHKGEQNISGHYFYETEILKIKFNLHKKLKKELTIKYNSPSQIEIEIPSKSTVYIGNGINTHKLDIKKMKVLSKGKTKKITENGSERFIIERKGLSKYIAYYDIK